MGLGLNASTIKAHNEFVIVDLIRRYPVSRRELAELSGLTPATVSAIIARLIMEGVVAEGNKVPSRGRAKGGRRRTYLQLVDGSRIAGGILVDRTGIEGSVVDILGTIYAHHSLFRPQRLFVVLNAGDFTHIGRLVVIRQTNGGGKHICVRDNGLA